MRFMDKVNTQSGPGWVIGALAGGGVGAAIRREDLAGGMRCTGPCINLAMAWCEAHRVWYAEAVGCKACQAGGGG